MILLYERAESPKGSEIKINEYATKFIQGLYTLYIFNKKMYAINNFSWQDGYGSFSVSSSKLKVVEKYILNQPEHHKKITFKDELRNFFKEYLIEYDDRYVWD